MLGLVSVATALALGVGLFMAGASVTVAALVALAAPVALFALLAHRKTLWLAAGLATVSVGLSGASVGWLFGGWALAVPAGVVAGGLASWAYADVAKRLKALPDDWY